MRELSAIERAKTPAKILHVFLDGVHRDTELACDHFVRLSLTQQARDFTRTCWQPVDRALVSRLQELTRHIPSGERKIVPVGRSGIRPQVAPRPLALFHRR